MSERTPIKPEYIRKGDKIRVEGGDPEHDNFTALEYTASYDKHSLPFHWGTYNAAGYYLLNRPAPPLEPYWGMVIVSPNWDFERAIYSPSERHDEDPWVAVSEDHVDHEWGWRSNEWAKQKLAEGWKVLEKPEWAP